MTDTNMTRRTALATGAAVVATAAIGTTLGLGEPSFADSLLSYPGFVTRFSQTNRHGVRVSWLYVMTVDGFRAIPKQLRPTACLDDSGQHVQFVVWIRDYNAAA